MSDDTPSSSPNEETLHELSSSTACNSITTLIFDVDDTLYDVGTGFTAHRNGYGAQSFMVANLNFPDVQSAGLLRDEYFAKYHSTAKALTVAEREGKFPPGAKKFDAMDLAEWWATHLDYTILGSREDYAHIRDMLKSCPLQLVAFSNGPRKYVKRVLHHIGLMEFFPDDRLFAVDDVLPHCKPEREAFDVVFERIGVKRPEECVMIEDSMKNVRIAKSLGMRTVLVVGKGRAGKATALGGGGGGGGGDERMEKAADEAERTKPGDAPRVDDPAVDAWVEECGQIRDALPGLWETPPAFDGSSRSQSSSLRN